MQFMYADDLHSHLRQGEMMKKVVKYVRSGGCNRVLVMPNTIPEISKCSQALEYRNELMELEPKVDYLMTLYLSDKVSTDDLRTNAKSCHVQGVKCYPANVTTNSNMGFNTLEPYYPLFREMERLNLSLHIHGESPGCSPLVAEKEFLTNIENVCRSFPSLKVVMEHVSMKPSLELVKRTHNLGATVTPHHMVLTVSDVLETTELITLENVVSHLKDPFSYCKPLAKGKEDRQGILELLEAGHPRVFLGSDSAPHTIETKMSANPPAGVYTQPFLLQYLSDTFESKGFMDKLENFCCKNGQEFLGLPPKGN
ncbi:dihydroorotase [Theileria orientalis]|uniref:Dihydroorotase n=1 Tax=Theileria orientalis TaxID=68886 RepID=A0A976SKM9_THEOR|nr:dihydroorotase [Theileria orientalis]